MSNPADKRLIEDYIPIKAISAEASREKSIRHGHISTLHLWWARRPLVASRAAVFGALVSANAQPQIIDGETKQPMTITKFMIELCKWKVTDEVIEEARRLVREAYPDHPPKVLDMFAGGGSIPLEALRLGAEAYALDLNPVAHIIELATLVYPQKYGPKLAEDVRKWGEWVLERVKAEVGDLYPLIQDPDYTQEKADAWEARHVQPRLMRDESPEQLSLAQQAAKSLPPLDEDLEDEDPEDDSAAPADIPPGYLQPVAYLWTRTVTCPNPACRATVPLVRQTWLKKKKGDNVALIMVPHPTENRMAFHVRRAADPADFGFDPAGFSQRGNSICYRCGTTVNGDYIKVEGKAGRMSEQLMAIVCMKLGMRDKIYLSPDDLSLPFPNNSRSDKMLKDLTNNGEISLPIEHITGSTQYMAVPMYGLTRFCDLFTPRQLLTLLTFANQIRIAYDEIIGHGPDHDYAKAIVTYLAIALDKATDRNSTLCRWDLSSGGGRLASTFARQALSMVWDFAETNPFAGGAGDLGLALTGLIGVIRNIPDGIPANVYRSTATVSPLESLTLDVVVTDPPYYDNVPYSDLSDYFYVWLKRSIGYLYPEHLGTDLTPKKNEAVSAPYRHNNSKDLSRNFYENMMLTSFAEANRTLKSNGCIVTVYAHKTTAGWSTLVDAMRKSGFYISEAWPVDTELPNRMRGQDSAALASSFFLVARKTTNRRTGSYSIDVMPVMEAIVKERIRFFIESEFTGADLNIATVGAGLAPYTRYARVELPNGDELTAEQYLNEVQAEVVRVLLGEAANADKPTQYYIIARENYGEAWVDFDEANNLARATGIELDTGAHALTRGKSAMIEKKGAKIRLRDYTERGEDENLGLPMPELARAPLIDVLHRLLWLAENDNSGIDQLLLTSQPDRHWLRVVAETLKGRVLAGEPTPGAMRDDRTREQRAINILLASWRRIIDERKAL